MVKITQVSVETQGYQAMVAQVQSNGRGAILSGVWLGQGDYENVPANIEITGWDNQNAIVQVRTGQGVSSIGYKSDGPNFVIQQSGNPAKTLITIPMTPGQGEFNVTLKIAADGSLSMTSN